MPIAITPIRGLGGRGIIRDVEPYNLPLDAFSNGNNVRFDDGDVRRSPAFRIIDTELGADPAFIYGVRPASGDDTLLVVEDDGTMYSWSLGTLTDITPAAFTTTTAPTARFTGTYLDQVAFINRQTDVPYALLPGATEAAPLTDYGWDATWRCKALRAYRDSLVAISMSEYGVEIPGRIRISDAVVGAAEPPASWDATDITNQAFSTELPDIRGTLLDGLAMRDDFYIYSTAEVWRITPVGGFALYAIKKVFSDQGILTTGLVTEVNGSHFVVGEDDIYIHDGTTYKSVVDGVNRKFIFNSMRKDQKHRFWLHHDTIRDEVMFAYVSGDPDAGFPETVWPNRAAVFDLENGTWSFQDLPNVSSATTVIYTPGQTWESWGDTWATTGGTWDSSGDGARTTVIMAPRTDTANGIAGDVLYAFDEISEGSQVFAPLDLTVLKPAFVERIGYDLDDIGHPLRDYIRIQRLYPQARVFGDDAPLQFRVGGQLFPQGNDDGPFQVDVPFDPATQHKIDFRKGGRYVSIRVQMNAPADFVFSGFDLQYTVTGRR